MVFAVLLFSAVLAAVDVTCERCCVLCCTDGVCSLSVPNCSVCSRSNSCSAAVKYSCCTHWSVLTFNFPFRYDIDVAVALT